MVTTKLLSILMLILVYNPLEGMQDTIISDIVEVLVMFVPHRLTTSLSTGDHVPSVSWPQSPFHE